MKTRLVIAGLIVILIVAATGCAPAVQTAAPTEPPTVKIEPTETDLPPQDTETPVTETPAITATAVPSMEVGSTYFYVDGTTLVAIPAGEFVMGGDGEDNVEHSVALDDYWIYSTKVTNQQYALCVTLGHCTPPNLGNNPFFEEIEYANNPVVGVTHDQAAAYCSFVNGRLPTEAEWEKAARGPDGNMYPWGDSEPSCDLLNYNSCITKTSNVVNYPQGASYYSALDMAGNVFEWVADWYQSDYYSGSPSENPTGPDTGVERSIRSSGFVSAGKDAIASLRFSDDPQNSREDLGFRCVVDEPAHFASFCEAPLVQGGASAAASESCPVVDIEQYPACIKKLSTTNVVFIGPDDAAINTGGCAPTANPREFSCLAVNQISISAGCEVDLSGDSSCAPGYTLEGSTCQPSGAEGDCLPGMEFNSDRGCCGADSQTETSLAASACPVGTFKVAGQNTCTATPVKGIVSVVELIQLESCTGGGSSAGGGGAGGAGPTACPAEEPPDAYCDAPAWVWSATLCRCECIDLAYCGDEQ